MTERRQSHRYQLLNEPLAVHFNKIGQIENMSVGGLCCSCINDEFDPASHNKIDIRCQKVSFCLQNIGIKVLETKVRHGKSFSEIFMRRCHVKFEDLSDEEIKQLEDFITANGVKVD